MSDNALRVALESILRDSAALVRDTKPASTHRKGYQDYVSDVDLRLDQHLTAALSALTPGVPVLSEERDVTRDAPVGEWWIIDPIDGTGNLLAGIPFVGISAALVDRDGPRIAGVAAAYQDNVWSAMRHGGAFVDGKPLQLASQPPELVVASTGFLDRIQTTGQSNVWRTLRLTGKLRNFGAQSLHLCGVAQGWFAASMSVEAGIWDEAAGGLVVREAGGIWQSSADCADWSNPAAIMPTPQESLAGHPHAISALAPVMSDILRRQA